MKPRLRLKEKKIIQGSILFCALVVITLSLIGDKGMLQLMALKEREKTLEHRIERLKQEHQEWVGRVHSLKTNRTYLETIAREELGMIRKDEFLIKLRFEDDFYRQIPDATIDTASSN